MHKSLLGTGNAYSKGLNDKAWCVVSVLSDTSSVCVRQYINVDQIRVLVVKLILRIPLHPGGITCQCHLLKTGSTKKASQKIRPRKKVDPGRT